MSEMRIKSSTIEAFDEQMRKIEQCYLPKYVNQVGYLKTTWLDLYKEKLAMSIRAELAVDIPRSVCLYLHGHITGKMTRQG